ncbi:MAG: hypothetical protein ACKPHU_36280, partial [Planctomycetaceae bacterium]
MSLTRISYVMAFEPACQKKFGRTPAKRVGLCSPADFTIAVGVGVAPVLQSPTRFAGVRPNFFWQAGSNAITYEILVKDMTQTSQPTVINVR